MRLARYMLFLSLGGCSSKCGEQETQARTSLPISKVPPVPSFGSDILPVLVSNCATAEGCHGNKPTPSVNLDLRASAAYRELVDMPSEARRGAVRVKSGDAQVSFLLDKLAGRLGPVEEGKRMPIDADTGAPVVPSPLSSDFMDVLERWIAAGAPNN